MQVKLDISDERMLALMKWAIDKGIKENEGQYLEAIGFTRNNIRNIRAGINSFTLKHIVNACNLTGASANWLLGLDNQMLRKPGKSAIEILKDAVVAVEQELKKKK